MTRDAAARLSLSLASLLSGSLLLAACGREPAVPSATVTDSAGVTVVINTGEDRPLDWAAEPVMRLAALDEEGEGFFQASDLAVVERDRIAVLDGMTKRVVLYDRDGTFLAQYGREGSGPGEFQFPMVILAMPHRGVGVFDAMNHRLERFDSTLAPGAPDPFAQLSYFGGHMAYAGAYLVFPTHDYSQPDVRPQALTAVGPRDTLEIVQYVQKVGGAIQIESCGMGFNGIEPIFSPTLRWSEGLDGTVAVVGTEHYEVDLYRAPDFRLQRRIRRQVPTIEATLDMAVASVGNGMRVMTPAGERVCDAKEVAEKRGFTSEVPPIGRVAVSPAGELWVERWASRGEPRAIDVLDPDGEYLGTLPLGFPFPDEFLGEDSILKIEKDELDVASVGVYRVVR